MHNVTTNNTILNMHTLLLYVQTGDDSYGSLLLLLIERVVKTLNLKSSKALNFGCGTGFNTFMLTKIFHNVRELSVHKNYRV